MMQFIPIQRKANILIKRLLFWSFILGILTSLSSPSLAHYPFPCSEEEVQKAKQIEDAVSSNDQNGVDILIQFAKDKNPRVQTAAVLSLGKLTASSLNMKKAIPILTKLQYPDKGKDYLRAAAKVTLILMDGKMHTEEKQDKLIKLTQDEGGYMRRMAVEGLKIVGNEKCLFALEKRINDTFGDHDDSYDMKAIGRVAFEAWWKIRSRDLRENQKITLLITSLEAAEPFWSRWGDAVCVQLIKIGNPVVPYLIKTYENKDRNARLWAARTLKDIGLEDRVKIKKEMKKIAAQDLRNEDKLTRHVAIGILTKFKDQEDTDLFIELLKNNKDPYLRSVSAAALGDLKGEKAIETLLDALKDEDEMTKVQAAYQLAKMGEDDGYEILLDSFGSLNFGVLNISMSAIKFMNEEQVFAKLIDLLEMEEINSGTDVQRKFQLAAIKVNAIRELSKMPQEKASSAIPILKVLLKYPDDSVSRPAANLLKKLGIKLKWTYDIEEKRGWYEVINEKNVEEK